MPWVHTHIDTDGLVKACCNANITFGNIREEKLGDIWNGEPIKKFRKLMMAGEQDRRCASCFRKESAGKRSMRIETLEKFQHKVAWVDQTEDNGHSDTSKPIYFDIRFNNLCNLRCRTCWHGASSSWYDEAKLLRTQAGDQAIISATDDSQQLIDQLITHGIAIEEIYFAGGEPLMMQEHYDWLDALIATGNTKVHLRYNTNLSKLTLKNSAVLDYWKKFDRVTVSASIDGLGARGEYIRKGLKWQVLINHIHMIKARASHVQLQIAPTVSVFNVLTLAELHGYFVNEALIGLEDIYLNVLSRPDYYHINVLPEPIKRKATELLTLHIDWLRQKACGEPLIEEFESIINLMNQKDRSARLTSLQKQLHVLDEMRKESLEDIFPELSPVLLHST